MNNAQTTIYRCVECGVLSGYLYKQLKAGIIKVAFCTECGYVTDKYILCDPVIMMLDALLHKPQVYRHLLYNIQIPSPWKIFIIFLLCDTYMKWGNLHGNNNNRQDDIIEMNPVFYAALEVDFYKMSCVAVSEWICFNVVILLLLKSVLSKSACAKDIVRAVIISSFGKLLVIPAIVWGQSHSDIYLWLTHIFVLTSNVTALRVLCDSNRLCMTSVVAVASFLQYTAGRYITDYVKLL